MKKFWRPNKSGVVKLIVQSIISTFMSATSLIVLVYGIVLLGAVYQELEDPAAGTLLQWLGVMLYFFPISVPFLTSGFLLDHIPLWLYALPVRFAVSVGVMWLVGIWDMDDALIVVAVFLAAEIPGMLVRVLIKWLKQRAADRKAAPPDFSALQEDASVYNRSV